MCKNVTYTFNFISVIHKYEFALVSVSCKHLINQKDKKMEKTFLLRTLFNNWIEFNNTSLNTFHPFSQLANTIQQAGSVTVKLCKKIIGMSAQCAELPHNVCQRAVANKLQFIADNCRNNCPADMYRFHKTLDQRHCTSVTAIKICRLCITHNTKYLHHLRLKKAKNFTDHFYHIVTIITTD